MSVTERGRRLQLLFRDISRRERRHVCITHDTDPEYDTTDVVRTLRTPDTAEGAEHRGMVKPLRNVRRLCPYSVAVYFVDKNLFKICTNFLQHSRGSVMSN